MRKEVDCHVDRKNHVEDNIDRTEEIFQVRAYIRVQLGLHAVEDEVDDDEQRDHKLYAHRVVHGGDLDLQPRARVC